MREQEEERKKRIHENAQASIKRANMPPRMQKDADRKKQIPPKDLQEQYSFRPKIGKKVTGEMFKAMQRNFEDQLQRKKSQTAHTIPKSPNFEKVKSRPLDRDQFNEAAPKIQ